MTKNGVPQDREIEIALAWARDDINRAEAARRLYEIGSIKSWGMAHYKMALLLKAAVVSGVLKESH